MRFALLAAAALLLPACACKQPPPQKPLASFMEPPPECPRTASVLPVQVGEQVVLFCVHANPDVKCEDWKCHILVVLDGMPLP